MKNLVYLILLVCAPALAQKVDLKDVDSSDDSTTIEITKNKKKQNKNEAIWEVAEGNSDVLGEGALMLKGAKDNWRKACDAWKKEFRGDNKENQIINMNCGEMNCSTEANEKVCTSKASYKIKTKLN
jgi:hypothetical protein